MGGLGCCCCTCETLNDYLVNKKITIPGHTQLGDWVNISGGYSGSGNVCCYQATFTKDDCSVARNCEICGPHVCEFINVDCSVANEDGSITRDVENLVIYCGKEVDIARGCVRDVRIYRYWYDDAEGDSCGPLAWCKLVIFAGWRDYIVSRLVQQNAREPDIGDFVSLSSCPMPLCNSTPCTSPSLDLCDGAQWACYLATYSYTWWRVRAFDTIPSGSVCFFNSSDVDLSPCNSFLKCVPETLPFRNTAVCFPNPPGTFTQVCNSAIYLPPCSCNSGDPNSPLNCNDTATDFSTNLDPICLNPPASYCLEFDAP